MPQMSPINWLFLFMFFLVTLYMLMNNLYFNFNKTLKMKNKKILKSKNYNKSI